tara:strand:- start:1977 stop:3161 length:1185 start_codon:yes stop_codon:yes gene_type:complete
MGLESATYISQLVDTNPTTSDPVSQGDDHLRLIKSVLQDQFTTLGAAAVTTTAAELNLLDGKTSVGDASGPASSTDNAIARFDGTGGKTLQNSSTTISDDGDIVVGGTTPTITIGDGGEEDAALVYDGHAKDFYIGLDDTADKLVIGEGSTVGTNNILTITDDTVTIGDGAAVDTAIVFDGNAKDFHIALDDTADKLIIGEGSTVGTNEILSITDDTVTIGDGAAVDTYLNFDGAAADFRVGIDDGTDKLEIGVGVAHGTTAAIAIDSSADMLLGGYLNFQDEQAIRPMLKDYSETKVAMAANAVDLSLGNVQTYTLSGSQTLTFTNPIATGNSSSFTLIVTNGGSATLTWPTSVDWAAATAPTLTSSGVDVITFTTIDGGTIWYGFAAGLAMG